MHFVFPQTVSSFDSPFQIQIQIQDQDQFNDLCTRSRWVLLEPCRRYWISSFPSQKFTHRAATKKKSDRRFRYFSAFGSQVWSSTTSGTTRRSARRHVVLATCN
mmetsp:Transcript_40020/g.96645  ORF Transcript_40020/g.96645 Transcript_40020/m.96645 type:complete len:104 (-) Transcript_40020:239-550(-)